MIPVPLVVVYNGADYLKRAGLNLMASWALRWAD
jgi:hypothetical protein